MNTPTKEQQEKFQHHFTEIFKLAGFGTKDLSKNVIAITHNEWKGPMKQLWVLVIEDENGNECLYSQPAVMLSPMGGMRIGGSNEVSPYEHEQEVMKKHVEELNNAFKPLKMKVKIKKFMECK